MNSYWNKTTYNPISINYSLFKNDVFSLVSPSSFSIEIDSSFKDYLKNPFIFGYSKDYYQKKIKKLSHLFKKEKKIFDLYSKRVGDLFFQNRQLQMSEEKKNVKINDVEKILKQVKSKKRDLEKKLVAKQIDLVTLKCQLKVMNSQFLSLKEQYVFKLNSFEFLSKELEEKENSLKRLQNEYKTMKKKLLILFEENQKNKNLLSESIVKKKEIMACWTETDKILKSLKKDYHFLQKGSERQEKIKDKLEKRISLFLKREKFMAQRINVLKKQLLNLGIEVERVREESYEKYLHVIKKLKFQKRQYQLKNINKLLKHAKKIELFYHEKIEKKDMVIEGLHKEKEKLKQEVFQKEKEKKFLFQSYMKQVFSKKFLKKGKQVVSLSRLLNIIKNGTEQEKARAILVFSHINDERIVFALREFLQKTRVPWLKNLAEETLNFVCLNKQYA